MCYKGKVMPSAHLGLLLFCLKLHCGMAVTNAEGIHSNFKSTFTKYTVLRFTYWDEHMFVLYVTTASDVILQENEEHVQ
jgi:hypothetical protein